MNLNTPLKEGTRSLKMAAKKLEKLGIYTLEDFLYHLPSRYEDYSKIIKISEITPGEKVTVQGNVIDFKNQYLRGGRIKTIQKAIINDGSSDIDLTWFNQPYLHRVIKQNDLISASGKAELFGRKLSLRSPEFEIISEDLINTGRYIPVYPETKGVSSKWFRKQISQILKGCCNDLPDYLPSEVVNKFHFFPFYRALQEIHFPENLETAAEAKQRLAFDELFLIQLASLQRKKNWLNKAYIQPFSVKKYQNQISEVIKSLPFTLTQGQKLALQDIFLDLEKNIPMNRLLQGDVGSGKTIIAALASYTAYLNGFQSLLLAPTEILAEQHFKTISETFAPLGLNINLITGSNKNKHSDNTDLLIGTHALLSKKIKFSNLALVIIDEQQRFGVLQRGIIREKGNNTHLLTMTATPIPRTVALTVYGELSLSYLNQMPQGRTAIKTWLIPQEKRESAYKWIRKEIIRTKSQAFIVCPFIEESENMQTVKAATKEFNKLARDIFPDLRLGLLHGKLKSKEKQLIMEEFKKNKFDILITTPVVEVGIDIPNATIILIEGSERFGLSQLHQLRGRVGRGEKMSYCLLFSESNNEIAITRLKALETTHSGAELAELDLKLRGPGDIYGINQHGLPNLKAASFTDSHLIQQANREAKKIFSKLSEYPLLEKKLEKYLVQNIVAD